MFLLSYDRAILGQRVLCCVTELMFADVIYNIRKWHVRLSAATWPNVTEEKKNAQSLQILPQQIQDRTVAIFIRKRQLRSMQAGVLTI